LKANGKGKNNVFGNDKKDTCTTKKTDKMVETKVEEEHDIGPEQGGAAGDRDHDDAPLVLQ
jgi:hypothetical protein